MTFSLFAYRRSDTSRDLTRRGLPLKRLNEAVRWAVAHGCDSILIDLSDDPPVGRPDVVHHVCSDPDCPGGC